MVFVAWSMALATGALFVYALRPGRGRVLTLGLGMGVGLGLSSLTALLAFAMAPGHPAALFAIDGLLFAAVAAAAWRRRRPARPRGRLSWPNVASLALFGAAGAVGLTELLRQALLRPYGDWDAWGIWNLKARLIVRGGEHWHAAFAVATGTSHPEYPLLVPSAVARAWTYAGAETQLAPALVSFGFAVAIALTLASAVAERRGWTLGGLAGTAVVLAPAWLRHGWTQQSDVPLAFFILAALTPLCLEERPSRGSWALAGLAAGLAAWTKNEGLLFLLLFAGLASALALWRRDRRFFTAALGLAPVLGALGYFKLTLARPGGLFASTQAELLARITDPGRYLMIGQAFWHELARGLAPALVLMLVVGGVRPNARLLAAGSAIALMALGYAAIYVITPFDLAWHLRTSLDRLLLQIYPAGVLVAFMSLDASDKPLGAG